MTKLQRRVNMTAVLLPFVVVAIAVPFLWGNLVGWSDIAVFVIMYTLSGFGVTVGFHRMLTHRAFATSDWMRHLFAILGSFSVQGPVIEWVADHRKHHAHTDVEGDPHSPHVGHGDGLVGALKGLYHAHMAWLWRSHGEARAAKYAKELLEDRTMRKINRRFPLWVYFSLALPAALGFVFTGFAWQGALTGLLWGGFARIFFQHHITWSVNSVCHFFGTRRFAVEDHSTNVFWLALPSLGESWHHNHHAFPRSAAHGLGRWELDPSAALIALLAKLGLVWDVVQIAPERQEQKLAGQPEPSAAG